MNTLVAVVFAWEYMLGAWPIGPFTTWQGCEETRQYQLTNGAAERLRVGPCKLVKDQYEMTAPTYGAPLTPAEHEKRR
mgnify:CR=1 FL=1